MRNIVAICAVLGLLSVVLAGCGGSGAGLAPAKEPPRAGATLTQSPSLEEVQAALAAIGKPLPEFLAGGVEVPLPPAPAEGAVAPQAYMTVLSLDRWLYNQYVDRGRTQWYECNLTSRYALTDVYVWRRSGDPDLYVFSPLRPGTPSRSLRLVGYSAGYGDEQVGSFITADWGGPGRFVIAVYGYSSARYDLKIW